jgi:hypothetical protein
MALNEVLENAPDDAAREALIARLRKDLGGQGVVSQVEGNPS